MRLLLAASLLLSWALSISARAADELPLTLTITGPEAVTMGEPILIQPILKNGSTSTISGFEFGAPYTILIHDERGMEVKPNQAVWAGSSAPVDFRPRMVRADFPVRINSGFKLVRGKYTVQFARHLDSKDPNSPMLKSNKLTITVVAPSTEVEKARSNLSINLKTSAPSFRVGAPVIVHIALMNKSGEDMPIAKNPSNEAAEECCYLIDVRRQDGKPAIYTRYGEEVREPHDVISRVLKTLHDNEQLEEDLPLNKIVDLSLGTYTVQLLRANPLHPATIIESNVLPIQIKVRDQVR